MKIMPRNKPTGDYDVELHENYYREALDRCDLVNRLIDNALLHHPAIMQTPDWREKIEQASVLIAKVYQLIGEVV